MTETDPVVSEFEETSFPWPPREGASVLDAFVTTWRESVFQPTSFFRRMPREGNYGAVIAFYLVISVVAAGVQLFWHSVLPPFGFGALAELMRERDSMRSEVLSFLFSPVLALIVLYVVAGVAHVMLSLLRANKNGFETTTRVVAFSHGPALFVIVPYVGSVIGGIWTLVLAIIGFREAQETTTGKAAAAVLIPIFLLGCLIVVLAIAIAALGLLNTRV